MFHQLETRYPLCKVKYLPILIFVFSVFHCESTPPEYLTDTTCKDRAAWNEIFYGKSSTYVESRLGPPINVTQTGGEEFIIYPNTRICDASPKEVYKVVYRNRRVNRFP
jgi:hypothetical protein